MLSGIWKNKESILYSILTIFLLERVRRGWNRIEKREAQSDPRELEKHQQTYLFGVALLYALPFVMPALRYFYRSVSELSVHVNGLEVLSNIWAMAVIALFIEAVLSIVIYNLLGIYIEKMNAALGFFRRIGHSVGEGSRTVTQAISATGSAGARFVSAARDLGKAGVEIGQGAASSAISRVRPLGARVGRVAGRATSLGRRALRPQRANTPS